MPRFVDMFETPPRRSLSISQAFYQALDNGEDAVTPAGQLARLVQKLNEKNILSDLDVLDILGSNRFHIEHKNKDKGI